MVSDVQANILSKHVRYVHWVHKKKVVAVDGRVGLGHPKAERREPLVKLWQQHTLVAVSEMGCSLLLCTVGVWLGFERMAACAFVGICVVVYVGRWVLHGLQASAAGLIQNCYSFFGHLLAAHLWPYHCYTTIPSKP